MERSLTLARSTSFLSSANDFIPELSQACPHREQHEVADHEHRRSQPEPVREQLYERMRPAGQYEDPCGKLHQRIRRADRDHHADDYEEEHGELELIGEQTCASLNERRAADARVVLVELRCAGTEREVSELSGAQALADKISKVSVAFAVKTGEGGKMFGAITSADIHQKLVEAGVEIDKRKIHLHTPVKTLGKHEVKIKLHADVSVDVSFDVVSENPIVEAAATEAPKSKEEYPEHRALEMQAARRAEKAKRSDRKK